MTEQLIQHLEETLHTTITTHPPQQPWNNLPNLTITLNNQEHPLILHPNNHTLIWIGTTPYNLENPQVYQQIKQTTNYYTNPQTPKEIKNNILFETITSLATTIYRKIKNNRIKQP